MGRTNLKQKAAFKREAQKRYVAKLLTQLKASQECLDRIADRLLFEDGKAVTSLTSREIEETYLDAIQELAMNETVIQEAEKE